MTSVAIACRRHMYLPLLSIVIILSFMLHGCAKSYTLANIPIYFFGAFIPTPLQKARAIAASHVRLCSTACISGVFAYAGLQESDKLVGYVIKPINNFSYPDPFSTTRGRLRIPAVPVKPPPYILFVFRPVCPYQSLGVSRRVLGKDRLF